MSAVSISTAAKGHAERLRGYLVRLRRAEGKRWSHQHEDAWQVLNSLNDLLNLLQSLDQQAEGRNIHITMALRSHGRVTETDRAKTVHLKTTLGLIDPPSPPRKD